MDNTTPQRARVSITVEVEITDPTALRAALMTETADGDLIVWNRTDEESAAQVLVNVAMDAWSAAATSVGLGPAIGTQSHVIPQPDNAD